MTNGWETFSFRFEKFEGSRYRDSSSLNRLLYEGYPPRRIHNLEHTNDKNATAYRQYKNAKLPKEKNFFSPVFSPYYKGIIHVTTDF